MDDPTAFQRDPTYVISGADRPSGQLVRERIQGYYEIEINHGRLYPNSDAFVETGLVEKGKLDRRTNHYAITVEGEAAIRKRREWESVYVEKPLPAGAP